MNQLKAFSVVVLVGTATVLLQRAEFLWPPSTKWLWAGVGWAIAFAIILAWRSIAPRGTGWAPGLLLLVVLAGVASWIHLSHTDLTIIAGLAALGASLVILAASLRPSEISSKHPLTTVLWVRDDATWCGRLPKATRVRVLLGATTLDLTATQLDDASEVHLTVVAGRVNLVVRDSWNIVPIKAGGPGLRFEGQPTRTDVNGPPFKLRLIGALGTVSVKFVGLPPRVKH